jgi:quinol monooxygenase YgiN
MTVRNSSRPIARVFRATAAPGCRNELLEKFHSSSATLVNSKAGCLKYRILEPVDASASEVVFESIWRDCAGVRAKSSSILPLQSFVTSAKCVPRPRCTDSFKTQRSKRSCTVIFSPTPSCSSCVVGSGTRISRAEREKSRVQREAGSSSQGYFAVNPGLKERSKQSNAQRTVRMSLYLSCHQVWTAARASAPTRSV